MPSPGKVWQMIEIITKDGWYRIKSNSGDHRQYLHPIKKGKVTVDGKPSDDVHPKTWRSMLAQAGLK